MGENPTAHSQLIRHLDPFQRQRAIAGVRARAERIVRRDLPELPLPIRAFCAMSFGSYDFASESFPVTQPGCDDHITGAERAELVNWGAAPGRLAMPPDQAEQFAAAQGSLYNRLVSFDAMLDIDVRTTEAGSELVLSFSDRANFRMYSEGSFTEAIHSFGAAAPVAAAAPVNGREWDLGDRKELAELAALGGAPVPFPFDGRALMAMPPQPVGTVTDLRRPSGRALMAMPPQPVGTVTDLRRPFAEGVYAAFSPANDTLADRVAAALAVPREHLVQLVHVGYDRGPIAAALALLPAPAEAYAGQPPADRYGRGQLVYSVTSAIDGVHLFDAGGDLFERRAGAPVLVARLRPVEARFVADAYGRDSGEVLERFDLSGIPSTGWEGEVIAVPPRFVQFVKAVDALGGDPVQALLDEGVGSELNEFARRDFAVTLAAKAREDTTPVDEFWVAGEIDFGEYGFNLGAFPAQGSSLRTIDVLRPGDLAGTPFRTSVEKTAFHMPMPQDAARAWVEAHPGSKHPYRARVRLVKPEETGCSPRPAPAQRSTSSWGRLSRST